MRIVVGVSGGIAAYKAAELVRALQRAAFDVHVVMTEAATQFVQPLTFASLTGHRVITSLWNDMGTGATAYGASDEQNGIDHIEEAQWADALVVAPATANILAKFAHGIADDFLSTLYLATQAPVLVAPAMNVNMWEHPATQANLEILRQRGVLILSPGTGELACGMVGKGRMADPAAIADAVERALGRRHDLAGEVVLVTAGVLLATAPAARWATPWPRPRRAVAPKSSSSAPLRRCTRQRAVSCSRSPRPTRCAKRCWDA